MKIGGIAPPPDIELRQQPAMPARHTPPATVTADRINQRLAATQTWLSGVNQRHYTIQISLGFADEPSWLERFLSQDDVIELNDDIHIYFTEIQGRQRIGVVYGEFTSYGDAKAALANLPDTLRHHQPFLRNIRQIAAESAANATQTIVRHEQHG